MSTDLVSLKKLENEIGKKLKESLEENFSFHNLTYLKDIKGNIIRLALKDIELENIPSTILKFQKLKYLSLHGNQIRTLPPEIGQLSSLKELNISRNQLKTLPPEIGQLSRLNTLNLSSNLLGMLQPEIGKLSNLYRLYLSSNELQEIPPEIGQMIELRELNLNFNKIKALPPEIIYLTKLTSIDLKSNQLNDLPREISKLVNIESFNLYSNKLNKLLPEIGQLTSLKILDFSSNHLTAIPSEIGQLKNLKELYLAHNQLFTLPLEIGQLNNLTHLNLSFNHLSVLPSEIEKLASLNRFYLSSNSIKKLPPEIGNVSHLVELDLEFNELNSLPMEISNLNELKRLKLSDNPLIEPPVEIATDVDNINKIRNYYKELGEQGEESIFEAKCILLGEAGAGKTSLSEKLLNPDYQLNPSEPMTKGIVVKKWRFSYSEDITFQCNIWDFGGQEIMHATHRYFLTKRSLYILVADNRQEDTDFYYWLNIIELLSHKCPVIIVLNEKHCFKKYVPESILKSFDSVEKKVFSINLADNSGLSDLRSSIQTSMCNLPHVGQDPIPSKWLRIREELDKDERNYLSFTEYMKICGKHGIDDEKKALYISDFLHDLGVILHFQNDRILSNTLIRNSQWITDAVYQILFDESIRQNGGEFTNKDLSRTWDKTYYADKYPELLQLMLNFELCYEIGHTQKYIIPELLPEKSCIDELYWSSTDVKEQGILHFEYRYDFMPKGIISRLIVRLNTYIFNRMQWKDGVVLRIGNSRAEIVEYYTNQLLRVRISGLDRLEALAIIRKEVIELHNTFEKLKYSEMVPCNCFECIKNETPHFFEYKELLQYKHEGIRYIKCVVGKIKDVNVLSLISDVFIEEDEEIDEDKSELVYINFKPKINVDTKSYAASHATADMDVNININIKIDLPAIQKEFSDLKDTIIIDDPKLIREMEKLEDCLDEVTPNSDKEKLAKPMNKMHRFLEKVRDENSDIHKIINATKQGVEVAQKIGKTYNKFAQWLALPQVPDLFLGN